MAALQVTLSPEKLNHFENAIPASTIAGTRYDEGQINMLDGDR
jgi:hypothetical protein